MKHLAVLILAAATVGCGGGFVFTDESLGPTSLRDRSVEHGPATYGGAAAVPMTLTLTQNGLTE